MKFYLVYKNNGLYDPVLDDQEPIYEPIDPEGFDRPSQPTEVFHIQQFLDPYNLENYENEDPSQINVAFNDDLQNPTRVNDNYCEFDDPSRILLGDPKLSESRSLTASPFVLTTKPYRPFSTEPLVDIPAIEDPIILNPNYRDEFGKHADEDEMVETKFKLPVSEQYDPDWKRKEQAKKVKGEKKEMTDVTFKEFERKEFEYIDISTMLADNKTQVSKTTIEEFKAEQMTKEEIEFTKKMKQEIDIDKIEMTATNIVNESIEKAMTVAEEIKKEMNVELLDNSTSTDIKEIIEMKSTKESSEYSVENYQSTESNNVVTKSKSELVQSNCKTVSKNLSDDPSTDRASREIIEKDNVEVKVAKIVEKFDIADTMDKSFEDRRLSAKQDIEETIEAGSVRRKSMIFDKEVELKENIEIKDSHKKFVRETNASRDQGSTSFETSQKSSETKKNNKMSTSKLLAEQRAYTIGLQTIPNIRGTIHTNYHYNLLLKTFFIHLTDVMVALSRFILTEPVFSKSEEYMETFTTQDKTDSSVDESIKNEKREEKTVRKDVKKDIKTAEQSIVENKVKAQEDKLMEKSFATEVKEVAKDDIQKKKSVNIDNNKVVIEGEEKRYLSGSKMAQLSEKKSEELTFKMDAVISEFQNKTGIEESDTTQLRNRRSRSRSQVEEEVMKESDPLEWLAKRDSRSSSQEITELKTSSKSFSSTMNSSQKKFESHESKQITTTKPKDKQMYVAIVEAHVFTNKDAIFEEQIAEFSETSSVQSADEVNIAIESNEAVSTENVIIENKRQLKEEVAQFIVEEPRITSSAVTTKEAEVQVSKDITQDIKEIVQDKSHHESIIETQISRKKEIENIDIKKEQVSVKEETISKSISEKSKVNLEVSKKETVEIQELVDESSSIAIDEEVAIQNDSEMKIEFAEGEVKEQAADLEVSADVKVDKVVIKEIEPQVEAAELKIIKEQVVEVDKPPEIRQEHQTKVVQIEQSLDLSKQDTAVSLSKFIDISESSSCETIKERSENYNKEVIHESSFMAKSVESSSISTSSQKLTLRTDLAQQVAIDRQSSVQSDENNNIDTPTPSTVPPTPLTDEYVFKLEIPLPKITKTVPIQEDEDPNIVKKDDFHEDPNIEKKLIPHIETNLESPIIYDPPLPTPPEDKVSSPVYTKPGLKGGADMKDCRMEEILEIERKSSLLASAIDETIKSIEEYKEQVGIETKKMDVDFEDNTKIEYSAKIECSSKEESTVEVKQVSEDEKVEYDYKEEWSKVDKKVTDNAESVTELSKSAKIAITEVDEESKYSGKNVENNHISEASVVTENKSKDEISEPQVNMQTKNDMEEQIYDSTSELSNLDKILLDSTTNGKTNIDSEVKQTIIDARKDILDNKRVDTVETKVESTKRNLTQKVESTLDNENVSELTISADKIDTKENVDEEKKDPLQGFRSVVFNPEEIIKHKHFEMVQEQTPQSVSRLYMTPTGEILGTVQGIVDGLEVATVDDEIAKELGKPGMTEDKIAELISGESEMLREAHVMGLTRVLTSHMNRTNEDDSSVDFKKIKPIVESLHNSEVLKALNEELVKTKEEKKKEERKWTKFLQKPKRPVPKAKFGYYAYVEQEEPVIEEPYKVKIVKQPKPKVAPDYKPKNFDTGPLPWEERALNEPTPPPIEAEEPILVPEDVPEFLEAVDPLPESEVPDLEETGITLPPPEPVIEPTIPEVTTEEETEDIKEDISVTEPEVIAEEEKKATEAMEENKIASQLMASVQGMVDPNATLDQQLNQMRAQLAALAQLPGVIQQTLEMVTRQLSQITVQETQSIQETQHNSQQAISQIDTESNFQNEENSSEATIIEEVTQNGTEENDQEQNNVIVEDNSNSVHEKQSTLTQEEMEKLRKEEAEMLEEQRRIEKQKKEIMEQMRQEQESRQIKQRPTPRVGKPKPVFGPSTPQERPLVLPGGRKWRGPKDAYNEQMFAETLSAQAELIQGKTKGLSYESVLLPYDNRINFMKYEKPPVSLDHLQHSDVYKLVHNMDQAPVKRVEMLTPVIAEADYRERCRSVSPCVGGMQKEQHLNIPQQLQP
ncbi:LOW QUALITY PROTEIN: uncharacterized protein ACR2FA_010862 [Aphomia sociella]